jgi:hypothetical protein
MQYMLIDEVSVAFSVLMIDHLCLGCGKYMQADHLDWDFWL